VTNKKFNNIDTNQFVNRMQQILDDNALNDDDDDNSGKLDRKDARELQDLSEKLVSSYKTSLHRY